MLGILSIWVESPSSQTLASEFLTSLFSWNSSIMNHDPTHLSGHKLDLVISTASSSEFFVSELLIYPVKSSISDHSVVTFKHSLPQSA